MLWWNQELELQEWEDRIKSKTTRILALIMLFPNKNPPGYKKHVIYFIVFCLWIRRYNILLDEKHESVCTRHCGII